MSIPPDNKKSEAESSNSIVNMLTLQELEKTHVLLLKQNPEDTLLRVSLAWCLFMEALYCAGMESAIEKMNSSPETSYRNSQELFIECLKQANTATDIGCDAVVQKHLNQLEKLIHLSNGEAVVQIAACEQGQKKRKLVKDIQNLPHSLSPRLSNKPRPK